MSTAVTRRPTPAASSALPDGPDARSSTAPSGIGSASARSASGCTGDRAGSSPYLPFHRSLSGCPASSAGTSSMRATLAALRDQEHEHRRGEALAPPRVVPELLRRRVRLAQVRDD